MVEAKVGAKTNIGMPIGGTFGKIAWVSTYDNMAAFESTATKLLSDTEYTNLVESAAPYFLPGSVRDELWTRTPPEETLRKAA